MPWRRWPRLAPAMTPDGRAAVQGARPPAHSARAQAPRSSPERPRRSSGPLIRRSVSSSFSSLQAFKPFNKHPSCLRHAPLDRADRNPEKRGDLRIRMGARRGENQGVTKFRRQMPDLELYARRRISRDGRPFGCWQIRGQRIDWIRVLGVGRRRRPAPPQRTDPSAVQGFAPGNREKPSTERRFAAKARQLLPRDQKGLLRGLFRILGSTQRGKRRSKDDALVPRHQRPKRLPISGSRSRHERPLHRIVPAERLDRAGRVGERHEMGDGSRHWRCRHEQGRHGWVTVIITSSLQASKR